MMKVYEELLITPKPILESLEFLNWLDSVKILYKINNEDKVVIYYLDLIYQNQLILDIFKSYVNKISENLIFAGETKNILNYFGIDSELFIRDESTMDYYILSYGLFDIYPYYEIAPNPIDKPENLFWKDNLVYVRISLINNNEIFNFKRQFKYSRRIIAGLKAGVFCDNPVLEKRLFNVI